MPPTPYPVLTFSLPLQERLHLPLGLDRRSKTEERKRGFLWRERLARYLRTPTLFSSIGKEKKSEGGWKGYLRLSLLFWLQFLKVILSVHCNKGLQILSQSVAQWFNSPKILETQTKCRLPSWTPHLHLPPQRTFRRKIASYRTAKWSPTARGGP